MTRRQSTDTSRPRGHCSVARRCQVTCRFHNFCDISPPNRAEQAFLDLIGDSCGAVTVCRFFHHEWEQMMQVGFPAEHHGSPAASPPVPVLPSSSRFVSAWQHHLGGEWAGQR